MAQALGFVFASPSPAGTMPRAPTEDSDAFDPWDYDWCFPADEDFLWEQTPSIPEGVRVRGGDGSVKVVLPAVHQRLNAESPTAKLGLTGSADGFNDSCTICYTDPGNMSFECGEHFFCAECTTRYVRERLLNLVLPICPADGCTAELNPKVVRRLLDKKEFDKYLLVNLRVSGQLRDCPDCGLQLFVEDLVDASADPLSASARCPECKSRFCTRCWTSLHPSTTCEEAVAMLNRRRQKEAPKAFAKLAQKLGLKKCPGCNSACEKSDEEACDHMTCSCGFEFCWTCRADRKVIYAHGNHFHMPECRFHAAYDGPLEYKPEACERCSRRGRPCTPPRLAREVKQTAYL